MKRIIIVIASLLCALTASGQGATQKYVEQLKTTDELREAVWGIKAVKADGKVVAEYNSRTRMLPASNLKLITTGLALRSLGGSYRFTTSIAHSGSIEDGVLKGDLYIIGGGDPTLGATDPCSVPLQTIFSRWEKDIRDAGVTKVEGRLIGDGRYLDCDLQDLSWEIMDADSGDGAPMTGLSFDRGLQSFTVSPGAAVGERVKVEPGFPETPWMSWSHTATTSPQGSGSDLEYLCTPLAPLASMSGTFPLGAAPKKLTASNCFGAMTCAYYFYRYLENVGIDVSEGPADISPLGVIRDFGDGQDPMPAERQDALKLLGSSRSAPLLDIVRRTNAVSDNYYAEGLLRALAKEKSGSACADSCDAVRLACLEKLGVKDASRMRFSDGSGLSRAKYVSPAFMVDFLLAMNSSPDGESFRGALPQPGSGTLASRLVREDAATRARVYMKSGSMGGVRCYSGYILSSDGDPAGTIAFSILTNNTVAPTSSINFIMDKLIGLMASEN